VYNLLLQAKTTLNFPVTLRAKEGSPDCEILYVRAE
jgi:hypothetical protein